MPAPLSTEAKALIDRPNFAHLATLMSDGSPHSVPVWVGREGDRLLVCTSEGSLKGRNTRRDPRIALSIVDFHDPYEEVQLRGRGNSARGTSALYPRDMSLGGWLEEQLFERRIVLVTGRLDDDAATKAAA